MGVSIIKEGSAAKSTLSYWDESRRPLVSLIFVTPMLLAYEGGVLLLGADATRNGIDVYLRGMLRWLGFSQYFLLPVLTTALLLGWHHTTGQNWRWRKRTLFGMFGESLLLAFCLLLLARMQSALFFDSIDGQQAALEISVDRATSAALFVGYFGAGIYEELLFRLMLLPAAVALFRYCGAPRVASLLAAVIVTSFVFSAAHYQVFTFNAEADTFEWFSFFFRFVAGAFFSVLFLFRGFGVSAGAHALYDIFVQLFQ